MTKKPNVVKKNGRPVIECTDELALEICHAICTSNKGLKILCQQNPHWPGERTIREFLLTSEKFSQLYARAKMLQADHLAEETLEISDDSSRDTIIKTDKEGKEYEVCNNEWINRSKLRVDTRKWLTHKLSPKVYGFNLNIDGSQIIKSMDQWLNFYISLDESNRLIAIDRIAALHDIKSENHNGEIPCKP